jgi:hypothetical protein
MLLAFLLNSPVEAADNDAPALDPYLLVQVQATVYDMDENVQADSAGYGDPEDDPGFKLRRGRVGLVKSAGEGDALSQRLFGAVLLGYSSGGDAMLPSSSQVGLVEASFGGVLVQGVELSAGMVKVPFGRENLMSSRQIPFQERTVASNHLVSLREVGALASVEKLGARLQIGAFNGNGALDGDTDPGLMLAARAEYTLGEGDAYRTFGSVDGLTLGLAGDFYFNQELATTSMGYGGDIILRVKGLSALVEGHAVSIKPTGTTLDEPGVLSETLRWGGYGQLGYTLAERWEPVVRVEVFDEDTAVSDNGDLMHGLVGVNAHLLEDHLKLGGGYILRMETGGASVSNDTVRLWSQLSF